MMTHKIYHSLIAALIGAATTGAVQAAPIPAMGLRFVAAEAGDSSISVRSARVLPHERSMIVSMCIRVDRDLKGTESIELRPVLTDSTGHSAVLPSIFINGRTQHIAFQRDRRNAKRDLVTLRRRNGMEQTIDYLREVAYQPWMRKATLVLEEVACGCGIPIAYDSHAVATLRSDDTPRLAFRIPEVEEVKTRQESGRAFLAFQLGKSEILDNFRSNATELAKIMQAIDLVRNDSNVTVSHIAIHGYASPDGSLALNEKLSAERTQALKSWVMSKYQFDEALFTTAHTAEDWEGLVNFLRNNNTLEGREEILNIIATVGDLDKREARIREEFPSQYRFMLDNWYPFLRHSDYTVGYIVRPFTVEEAKRELKLHPQNLSIDEMFRIAQTYKEGSLETFCKSLLAAFASASIFCVRQSMISISWIKGTFTCNPGESSFPITAPNCVLTPTNPVGTLRKEVAASIIKTMTMREPITRFRINFLFFSICLTLSFCIISVDCFHYFGCRPILPVLWCSLIIPRLTGCLWSDRKDHCLPEFPSLW